MTVNAANGGACLARIEPPTLVKDDGTYAGAQDLVRTTAAFLSLLEREDIDGSMAGFFRQLRPAENGLRRPPISARVRASQRFLPLLDHLVPVANLMAGGSPRIGRC